MNKDIIRIKQSGKLVAISSGWQYWLMNDVLYSVSSSGTNFSVWCGVSSLNAHLHRLYQVIGHRFFTGDPAMQIVDRQFIQQFCYA